jgi:ABC-type Na+ transport system ATPase subunit NatA
MSEVELVSDDVVVIHEGRIRHASTLAALLRVGRRTAPLEERYLDLVGGSA